MKSGRKIRRAAFPLTSLAAMSLGALALHLRDPHQSGTWGYCPSFYALGFYCPGCGGLRAVNDITNLKFESAFHSNALIFLLGAPVVVFLLYWTISAFRGKDLDVSRHPIWVMPSLILVLVVFGIVRNFPGMEFLQPGY